MKILLDTSFLRHLEQVNLLWLLSSWSEIHAWKFVMPETIHEELAARNIPPEIENLLKTDVIRVESCNQIQLLVAKYGLYSLDEGELEAICIVDKCEDRTFKNYLILTDDCAAQKGAGKIGMESLDVLMFLLSSNQKEFLAKDTAVSAMETLEESEYHIPDSVREYYLNQIR